MITDIVLTAIVFFAFAVIVACVIFFVKDMIDFGVGFDATTLFESFLLIVSLIAVIVIGTMLYGIIGGA